MVTSQDSKSTLQAAWVSAPRSQRQRVKRPSPSFQVDLQPSKRPTHHGPSLFDGDDESMSQVTEKSPQIAINWDFSNLKSFLRDASINKYQPRINEILSSILDHSRHPSKLPMANMQHLWDDYLAMITICSGLISSGGIHTKTEADIHDALNWMSENWSTIPENPLQGKTMPETNIQGNHPRRPNPVIYHDTLWSLSLTRRKYSRKRERLAAKFIIKFMHDKRHDWIEPLNQATDGSLKGMLVWSLIVVRPSRYTDTVMRGWKLVWKADRRCQGSYEMTDELVRNPQNKFGPPIFQRNQLMKTIVILTFLIFNRNL